MFFRLNILIGALIIAANAFAQSDSLSPLPDTTSVPEKQYELVFKPTFGLGVGNFTFFGDVANSHKGYHALVSRIGYELKVNNPLTDHLDLGFYVIFGKISANERTVNRNLNFESRIRTGGAILCYNFKHLLAIKRSVEPYIFSGFESFEFLSKTDLFDQYGNSYNYWSDGSIRSLPEDHPNASNAIMVNRDYTYESDLREQNLDGFGKYRERSWSVPVGAGVQFLIGERVKFKIGTSYHFTFTDLVDNVTDESEGSRKGDSKNDRFLYTSFSLNYDLFRDEPKKKGKPEVIEPDEDDGPLVLDMTDLDNDGVRDFADNCLNTPPGVPVDEKGCPFDKDIDYVPDYRDDEKPTPRGNFVNEKGVTLTDADLEMMYLRYMDSTGIYHGGFEKVDREEIGGGIAGVVKNGNGKPKQNLTYFVIIGSEKKQIGANDLYKYLSQKDFKQMESGDTIYYVLGDFNTLTEALAKQKDLENKGIKTDGVGQNNEEKNTNDKLTNEQINQIVKNEQNQNNNSTTTNSSDVLFRVQIGAYDKKLSPKIFKNVPDLIYITGEDGITRYYSGSFNKLDDAAGRKIDMLSNGFESAFIVAYKDGKRIPLSEAGAHMVNENETENINNNEVVETHVNAKNVRFKVQIGAFKNDIPANVLDVFLTLGKVQLKRTDTGLTIYLVGDESGMEAADQLKNKMIEAGIKDAFVVGEFNGSVIPASEALLLLNK